MAKYLVAVSGGVDSVALLHMLATSTDNDIVVAHFDHGIRKDSAEDATFVQSLASKHSVPFETRREELGIHASEEKARDRRYAFLREAAKKHDAHIVTAHHSDDIVETVAINLHRGTGWRGLAVLDSDILRPLLGMSKSDLIEYARHHKLEWREDSTNKSSAYLRNRVRPLASQLHPDKKAELLQLRKQQAVLKKQIAEALSELVGSGPDYSRYFFTHIPVAPAVECLRHITKGRLTRPQLERALLAIKTVQPKSAYQAGSGVTFHFTTRNFSLSLLK